MPIYSWSKNCDAECGFEVETLKFDFLLMEYKIFRNIWVLNYLASLLNFAEKPMLWFFYLSVRSEMYFIIFITQDLYVWRVNIFNPDFTYLSILHCTSGEVCWSAQQPIEELSWVYHQLIIWLTVTTQHLKSTERRTQMWKICGYSSSILSNLDFIHSSPIRPFS